MTTKENYYHRKKPELQFRIIKAIALSGHSSNNKLTRKLRVSHPVISAALNSLKTAKLIEYSHSEVHIHSKGRSEIYYSLTEKGWKEFISEFPTPEEFCTAILNSHRIRAQSGALKPMNNAELYSYFEIYKQKYLGYTSTQGHLVQSPFFNKLYEQWLAEYRQSYYEQSQLKRISSLVRSPFFEECYEESLEKYDPNGITVVQKVLECLAIHRSITEKQIYEYLKLKHEETKEKLAGKIFRYPDFVREQIEHDYDVTNENISRVIDRYSHVERYT
jgi:DNA-binding MarR family transcriptional regulator